VSGDARVLARLLLDEVDGLARSVGQLRLREPAFGP
jgi:hypothetical protein